MADGVLRGGVMLISVYLWHTEGLTTRNLAILNAAGEAVARHGGPWIMVGDFNMTPEELQGAHEWLRKIGGKITAPREPTCRSVSGGRVIDFFVLDCRIATAVHDIWADPDFPSSPHNAVVLRLGGMATRELAKQLRRPRPFPVDKPIGCARKPQVPNAGIIKSMVGPTADQRQTVNIAFEHIMGLAEKDLCEICDEVDRDGRPSFTHLGRGKAPATYWGPVVPRSAGEFGRADSATLCFRWIAKAFGGMAGILTGVSRGRASQVMVTQWFGTLEGLRNHSHIVRRNRWPGASCVGRCLGRHAAPRAASRMAVSTCPGHSM